MLLTMAWNFISTTTWTTTLSLFYLLAPVGGLAGRTEISVSQREDLRDEVFAAFRHAYVSYMTHASACTPFCDESDPADELMPLSCRGREWKHRTRGTVDDALGGYALTMIDSLDMHAVVGDGEGFREATSILLEDFRSGVITFDRDVVVSVFEASIRVLGGLLSAHQIATELGPSGRLGPPGWYGGELLSLAHDLGKRLLPAFDTPLGIPVHRVNLRKGIPGGEDRHTCSAAAGTFLVEFGALSRLTGDLSFEAAARRAVGALWERRSPLGLVGGGVEGSTGKWDSRTASIGAGTDSFYEYLDKSARLFRDEGMGGMFREAYAGVEEHLKWGRWHVEVDMWKGKRSSPSNYRVTSLQAFWPAVQATAGNVRAGEQTFDAFFRLWKEYDALPDFYDVLNDRLLHYGRDSPLRPEMAESALALHRATGSTKYLRAGQDMLRALQENSRVACGFASVGDVGTGEMDDRMDSFFIAETLKYLFLLFDGSLPPEKRNSIFCTPEQEDEVVKHHDRRAAAAAAAVNSTTSATVTNGTDTGSTASGFSSVPVDERGRGGGDRNGGKVGGRNDGDYYLGELGGVGGQKSPPSSSLYAPQCLMWADTVLSTEGHPFLASTLATAVAGRDDGGGGLSHSGKERHKGGESSHVCSSSSTISSPSSNTDSRCVSSSSNQAASPAATVRQKPTVVSSPTPLKEFSGSKFDHLKDAFRLLRRGRKEKAQAETVTETTVVVDDEGARDPERWGGDGRARSSTLSSFDPRHHYSRAVRSEGFVARPKNAELDLKCHRTSGGMPTCEIFAVGPEVRAHMTLAVGEQLWSTAVVRVVDWVRDTVFSQEEAQQQQQQDGTGVGRGDRNSKISDGNTQHEGVLYRLHQISPAALLV
ncbi:unnamed protein product [Pylaiella littoralis]